LIRFGHTRCDCAVGGKVRALRRGDISKVVLIDFWTYSCINCLRAIPYVKAWAEKYKDHGLIVIGVHTPEFAFERKVSNVQAAVADLKIRYPVAIDSYYVVWRAFDNEIWPAHYFIDAQGRRRYHHFGEGRATATDTVDDMADMAADEAMTRRALELLGSKRNDAYEAALAALREDTQAWWADMLARDADKMEKGEEPATADVEGLRSFIEGEVLPWFENCKRELANRGGSTLARQPCPTLRT
jgi:thiol-disulfide isomerase/thioredoxin